MSGTAAGTPIRRPAGPADGTPVVIGFGGPARPSIRDLDPSVVVADYGFVVDAILRRLPGPVLRGRVIDVDDLRQEGLLALLDAAKTYDPTAGAAFPTYARTCVTNAIRMVLRKLDVLPSQVRADLRAVRAAEDQLAVDGPASNEAVAARTGLDAARVAHARRWQHLQTTAELDDALPAAAPTPEQAALAAEESRALRAAIAAMPEQHRRILLSRIVDEVPVRTLAAAEGLSPARISQVTTAAVRRLEDLVAQTS